MSDQLMVIDPSAGVLMPVMDLAQAKMAYTAMVDFVKSILKEDTDFGTIPGTPKPTLYKPGAEKLTRFFGLGARFDLTKEVEQWDGEEPFFSYRYKCSVFRLANGALVAEGEGSCNSHEKKYRYRDSQRVCPHCGKPTIIKGKEEYGGGWLCFTKKGGCNAKFNDNDPAITGQTVGLVINPDIADQVNTMQKMAQKRAFIAATLIACNASEFFTQDVEDLNYGAIDGVIVEPKGDTEPTEGKRGPSTNVKPTKAPQTPPSPASATKQAADASLPVDKIIRPMSAKALRDWFDLLYDDMPPNRKELIIDDADAVALARKVGDLGLTEKQRHAFSLGMFGVESVKQWSEAYAEIVRLWIKDVKSARTEALAFIADLEARQSGRAA